MFKDVTVNLMRISVYRVMVSARDYQLLNRYVTETYWDDEACWVVIHNSEDSVYSRPYETATLQCFFRSEKEYAEFKLKF